MKRGTRAPPVALVIALVTIWLLLSQTFAAEQILLGVVFAFGLAWASLPLRPLRPRLVRPWLFLTLVPRVLFDITRSNLGVARIVLGLVGDREIRSGFVEVPLELRDPHGLAVLAVILTSTPGTVWVDLAPDARCVTVHVLDLRDEAEWIHWIKFRYESVLMRIFE
jgi:multicomponent K+:H+ antiporter subunit E